MRDDVRRALPAPGCAGTYMALLLTARSPLLAPGTAQARVDSAGGESPGQPTTTIGVRVRVRFS